MKGGDSDRQTGRQTNRQTYRQAGRQRNRDSQPDRQTAETERDPLIPANRVTYSGKDLSDTRMAAKSLKAKSTSGIVHHIEKASLPM